MQNLKNIIVGFAVSFIGSIPLGYLNFFGFEIYRKQGFYNTCSYLFGVILIEFFVVYFTLIFAKKLASNTKLTKYIELFSIIFILTLSVVFFVSSYKTNTYNVQLSQNNYYKTFLSGFFLSAVNFAQIPFWTGWNLYLLNKKYIEISKIKKYFYVLGTIAGTFFGMLSLILILNYSIKNNNFINENIISRAIATLFFIIGIYQLIKFYFKYKNKLYSNI